jgi:hypothetical protein
MKIAINILIVLAGSVSTVIAFGGDNLRKGRSSFIQRITIRGWLALIALLIATGLGLKKVFIEGKEDREKDVAAAQAVTRELDLQSKLNAQNRVLATLQLSSSQTAANLKSALASLGDANQALADNKIVISGIAKIGSDTASQVSDVRSTSKNSAELIRSMDRLQGRVRDIGLATALSKSQPNLDVNIQIPLNPSAVRKLDTSADEANAFFPEWQRFAPRGKEDAIASLTIASTRGKWGSSLDLTLYNKREYPSSFRGYGKVEDLENIFKEGTTTELTEGYGNLRFRHLDKGQIFEWWMHIEKPLVFGDWVSLFKPGTKVFAVRYYLRDEISDLDKQDELAKWTTLYSESGLVEFSLLKEDNMVFVYPIKRTSMSVGEHSGSMSLEMVYSISGKPTLKLAEMLARPEAGGAETSVE